MGVRKERISSTKELGFALKELRTALAGLAEDDRDPAELLAMDARLAALCARSVRRVESERAAWVRWSQSPRSNRTEPG